MAEKRMRGKKLIRCLSCAGVSRYQDSHAAQITETPFYTTMMGQRIDPQPVFGRICRSCVKTLGYHRKTRKVEQ